ncbi:DUF4926 domain-containing protein [Cyclobacteriaceae bacterium YHN15]|nr:DUF4926 domain-containing protein [Cyclobacteriaceae bacterium YHN15]
MDKSFKLLDSVAILKDVPEQKVLMGQVGTIVEILTDDTYEVEFSDQSGATIAEFAVQGIDLLLLHHTLVDTSK